MTTQHDHDERALLDKIDHALRVVAALCDGSLRWTMSVPARLDSDPDLVIADALQSARAVLASKEAAPRGWHRLLSDARWRIANLVGPNGAGKWDRNVLDRIDAMLSANPLPQPEHGACQTCNGTGVDGDSGPDGRIIDVPCHCVRQREASRPSRPELGAGQPAIVEEVLAELTRATVKFPTWPTDPLHACAVLGEEFGELRKGMLQLTYEPHKTNAQEVRSEAIQTAAMALRLAMSLERYEYKRSAQHVQAENAGAGERALAAAREPAP